MNTNSSSMKSTNRLPEQQFRTEALKLISNVVSAREYLAHTSKERIHVPESVKQPVREQYRAYRNTWTPKGVARFLLRYEVNIRMMATGGQPMKNRITELIIKSKKYAENQTRSAFAS
jgi:hypothetical protein